MLAGEGLGGVLQALLAVAKVDGSREYPAYASVGGGFLYVCLTLFPAGFGTAIGCPGFEFCG